MATSDGKGQRPSPPPEPPPSEPMDVTWDDDTVPRLDFDDPAFDRVTTIPELPSELLAKRMMDDPTNSEPASGLFDRSPAADTATSASGSPIPFELQGALLSSSAPPAEGRSDSEPASSRSTAPPPRKVREEPRIEIDERAAESAIAARGRWARNEALADAAPRRTSLELDLSGFTSEQSRDNERVPSERAAADADPAVREMADRYATGDFSGALVVAEGILENDAEHAEALRFAKSCRDVLTQMYSARLGSLDQLVTIAIPSDQIRWLSLDHRSGFLLSLIDGTSSVEELLDISGMPRLDALRILYSLREERVVALLPRNA